MTASPIAILLIEDDAGDAFIIQRLLTTSLKVPFTITHVERLAKGLEALEKDHFDILMLDLGLPDSMGLDAFLTVRKKAPPMPVIVLTGRDDDAFAIEAVKKGAQDYLVKGQVTGSLMARSIRYAIEREKLLTQLENSLKEVKLLQGLLPICMHCKKIRDDQGYWTQMEVYISKHSEAAFSHGLCPECLNTFYPRYMKK